MRDSCNIYIVAMYISLYGLSVKLQGNIKPSPSVSNMVTVSPLRRYTKVPSESCALFAVTEGPVLTLCISRYCSLPGCRYLQISHVIRQQDSTHSINTITYDKTVYSSGNSFRHNKLPYICQAH